MDNVKTPLTRTPSTNKTFNPSIMQTKLSDLSAFGPTRGRLSKKMFLQPFQLQELIGQYSPKWIKLSGGLIVSVIYSGGFVSGRDIF